MSEASDSDESLPDLVREKSLARTSEDNCDLNDSISLDEAESASLGQSDTNLDSSDERSDLQIPAIDPSIFGITSERKFVMTRRRNKLFTNAFLSRIVSYRSFVCCLLFGRFQANRILAKVRQV